MLTVKRLMMKTKEIARGRHNVVIQSPYLLLQHMGRVLEACMGELHLSGCDWRQLTRLAATQTPRRLSRRTGAYHRFE